MTASPDPHQPSPFKVAAPQPPTAKPAQPITASSIRSAEPSSPPNTPSNAEPDTPKHQRRWLRLGGIALGLGLLSIIPTPYQVGGTVTLEWPEDHRQPIRSPIPAVVTEIKVEPGAEVDQGTVLVELTSHALDREIADVEEKLAKAREAFEEAQREQIQAEARVIEAEAIAQAAQVRSQREQNRLLQLEQGDLPPEVEGLVVQHERLQGQLREAQADWQRYQDLYNHGAISHEDLLQKERRHHDIERDLQAKAKEVDLAKRRVEDMATDEIGIATYQGAAVEAAAYVAKARQRLDAHADTIQTLDNRLTVLKELNQQLTLKANKTGTVLSDDLDLLVGQEVTPETVLLRIANLNQLTANVEVKEEDLDYVQTDAEVTFRPRQAKLHPYQAKVERILYDVQPDVTKQRRVAIVRVVIENDDQRLLRPGSTGYAKIFSEWIPLYERLGREIIKLVPERFL